MDDVTAEVELRDMAMMSVTVFTDIVCYSGGVNFILVMLTSGYRHTADDVAT